MSAHDGFSRWNDPLRAIFTESCARVSSSAVEADADQVTVSTLGSPEESSKREGSQRLARFDISQVREARLNLALLKYRLQRVHGIHEITVP
jgi:hypothetical protein